MYMRVRRIARVNAHSTHTHDRSIKFDRTYQALTSSAPCGVVPAGCGQLILTQGLGDAIDPAAASGASAPIVVTSVQRKQVRPLSF